MSGLAILIALVAGFGFGFWIRGSSNTYDRGYRAGVREANARSDRGAA